MSAWYILSAMGFYQVCPGSGEYVLGTPLFDEVTINLENGKRFVIRASQNEKVKSQNVFYVAATKLNGKPSTKSYLLHTDIMKGGILEFILTDQPNTTWGIKNEDLPHSKIIDEPIVPVPYFDVAANKFKNQIQISLKSIHPEDSIFYFIPDIENENSLNPQLYKGSFAINESCKIVSYAKGKSGLSQAISQNFYKIPSNKSITVLSKVYPMYTAGGPDALIDSIEGTTNWRTGEWQSYFDQDFEAIIDLQKSKSVDHLGIHVLQDVGPWILYPKEVIFYSSNDGKSFTEIARVENEVDQKPGPAQDQELGTKVSLQTRYIKVKAVNGGRLPSWHESAGNPSHIFIDEIIVR
jgi:Glycosyl hydrolase family 92/F5/8 type C domain